MEESSDVCMMMTAVDNETAAQTLAQGLVEAQLAACVQVLPVKSFYVWQGESRRDAEYLLLVKTRVALTPALETFIRAHHPYDVPELLRLPVSAGSATYLQWLRAGTKGGESMPPVP
jgi:periplasmic divalent cation tolerance protein